MTRVGSQRHSKKNHFFIIVIRLIFMTDRHTDARMKVRIICRQEGRRANGCRKGRRK